MRRKQYIVGGHAFSVEADDSIFDEMVNYHPFIADGATEDVVFDAIINSITDKPDFDFIKENEWEVKETSAVSGSTSDGRYVLKYYWLHQPIVEIVTSSQYNHADIYLTGFQKSMAIDMAMMLVYSHATAHLSTTIIHSSAICYNHHAYLFVGLSGTGKSTHSQLWLKHIEGTELINDDKPVIRIQDGKAILYGSPWSGKIDCYKNVRYPVEAVVKLKQAPHNKIRELGNVESYFVLLHCIYGKRWDKSIGDALHQLESQIVKLCHFWELECLPNQEAALLCKEYITTNI